MKKRAAKPASPDFQALFEAAPGLLLVLDTKFNVVAVTDTYLQATMIRRNNIVGRNVFEAFPEDNDRPAAAATRSAVRQSFERVLETRQPDFMAVQRYDIRKPESEGGGFVERYWSPVNVPVLRCGKVKYVIHRVHDVTNAVLSMRRQKAVSKAKTAKGKRITGEQWDLAAEFMLKETQAASVLRQKEDAFQTIVNSIPLLAWTADASGYIRWYNDRWYEYTGATPQQMAGWGWQSVHDPRMLPEVLGRWKESIATGQPFNMEFPLRSAKGEFRWFLTRIVPVFDENGNLTQWFGTNTDVNDIRRAQDRLLDSEARLKISEERMRLAQKAAKIGAWEFDIDRDEYLWTEEASAILGLANTIRRVAEKDFLAMMYVAADREFAVKSMRNAVSKKREYDISFRIRKAEGQFRWIAARGTPFFNQGRNVMIGVFIDITDARNAKPETLTS